MFGHLLSETASTACDLWHLELHLVTRVGGEKVLLRTLPTGLVYMLRVTALTGVKHAQTTPLGSVSLMKSELDRGCYCHRCGGSM